MRFYTQTHRYYCGIDLHARWMYLCVLDPHGEVLVHRNLRACPEAFLKAGGWARGGAEKLRTSSHKSPSVYQKRRNHPLQLNRREL